MSLNTREQIALQTACRRAIDELKTGVQSSDVKAALQEIANAWKAHQDGPGYTGDADVADACLSAAFEKLGNVRTPAEAVPQGQPLKPSTAAMPDNVQRAIGFIADARGILRPHLTA